jgi:hypothetical protein
LVITTTTALEATGFEIGAFLSFIRIPEGLDGETTSSATTGTGSDGVLVRFVEDDAACSLEGGGTAGPFSEDEASPAEDIVTINGRTGALAPRATSAETRADAGGAAGPVVFDGANEISFPVVGSMMGRRRLTGFTDEFFGELTAAGSETTEALLDSGGTDSAEEVVGFALGEAPEDFCCLPDGTNVGTFGFS